MHSTSLSGRFFPLFAALAAAAGAQIVPVQYGDPARTMTIASPSQTATYFFNGTQGDVLRIAFSSQNSGYPSYSYFHQLEVRQGATLIGSGIHGLGTLTETLPTTGLYTIQVRAQNNQSTGWYAFKLDRLDDPVGADRMALGWTLKGTIGALADFAVYTLRAEAGSTGQLTLTCQNSGYPSYTPYHYAELVDATGVQVASLVGNGTPVAVSFPASGVYTLFVAAQNWQSTGWYSASLQCSSWPLVSCDTVARSSNYGPGLAGTNGIPSLTTNTLPRLGGTVGLQVGSSAPQSSTALLLVSLNADNIVLSAYGGTQLVGQPTILVLSNLQQGGTTLNFGIPNDSLLNGLGFAVQSLVIDAGAPAGVAFSRGLLVLLGN